MSDIIAEGPWLRNWCQMAQQFAGNKLEKISGTTKLIDKTKWQQSYFHSVQVNNQHMFIKLSQNASGDENQSIWLRYDFLSNGRLYVNEREPRGSEHEDELPDLIFRFIDRQYLAFYGGFLELVPGPCKDAKTDILSDTFDRDAAVRAIMQQETPVCSILMDPAHFSGVWNIIKNEVLYKCQLHPLEIGKYICRHDAENLVNELVRYSIDWLGWKVSNHDSKEVVGKPTKMYWQFQCTLGHATQRRWYGETGLHKLTVWCPQCQVIKRHMPVHKRLMESVRVTNSRDSGGNDDSGLDTDETAAYDLSSCGEVSNYEAEQHDWRDVEEINVSHGGGNSLESAEESTDDTMENPDDDVEIDDDLEVLSVIDNSCIMLTDLKELKPINVTKFSQRHSRDKPKRGKAVVEQNLLKVYPNLKKTPAVDLKKLSPTEIDRRTCKYARCNADLERRSFNSKWHKLSHNRYNRQSNNSKTKVFRVPIKQKTNSLKKYKVQKLRKSNVTGNIKQYCAITNTHKEHKVQLKKHMSSTTQRMKQKWKVLKKTINDTRKVGSSESSIKTPSGSFIVEEK